MRNRTSRTLAAAAVVLVATTSLATEASAQLSNVFRQPPRSDTFFPFEDPPCGNGSAPIGVGKPFSPLTGKEFFEHTDLIVPGIFPIEVVRRYDSASSYQSALGYSWAFTHDWRVYEYQDGSVVVRNACGIVHRYQRDGENFTTPDSPGFRFDLRPGQNGGYILVESMGTLRMFDSEGRLTAIQSPQGNRHEFTYDSRGRLPLVGITANTADRSTPRVLSTTYRLSRIAERAANGSLTGRHVDFNYEDSSGRLAHIEANDGRRVSYLQRTVSIGAQAMPTGNLVKVIGLEGIEQTYEYNNARGQHLITSIVNGQGTTPWLNEYDAVGRITKQAHGDSVTTVDYNADFLDTAAVNLGGCADVLSCSIVKRTVVSPGQADRVATTIYKYRSDGYPAEIIDPLGHRTVYEYEPSRPYQIREQVFENRGTVGNPNRVLQRTTNRSFDADGNLTELRVVLDSGEVVTQRWTYQDNWMASWERLSSTDSTRIFRMEWTFERAGRAPGEAGFNSSDPISNVQSMRRKREDGTFDETVFDYNVNGQMASVRLPQVAPNDGLRAVFTYTDGQDDPVGLLKEEYLEAFGSRIPTLSKSYTYDDRSFLESQTDALGVPVTYAFDDLNRLISRTDRVNLAGAATARLETSVYTYTGASADLEDFSTAPPGRLLSQIEVGRTSANGSGQVTRIRHDGRGRAVRVERRGAGAVFVTFEQQSYDSDGNLVLGTDATGRAVTFGYDLLNRLVSVRDAVGNQARFSYDAVGNRTQTLDAKNRTTRFMFDDLDRTIAVVQDAENLTTRFRYDAADNLTSVEDPKGQVTGYAYDLRSRLVAVTQPLGVATQADPNDFTMRYSYDDRDQLLRLTNARGQVLQYAYAPWSSLALDGGIDRVEHYANSADADQRANLERRISYRYDARARMRSVLDTEQLTAVGAGPDATLEPAGRMYTFTYDGLERIESSTAHYIPGGTPGQGRSLRSAYDAFGNRTSLDLSDPAGSSSYRWNFDAMNRLVAACMPQDNPCTPGNETVRWSYFSNDEIDQVTHGNGTTTQYGYEPHGPIDSIRVQGASGEALRLTHDYDPTRNIATIREWVNGVELNGSGGVGPARSYGYDGIDRLTRATYPAGVGLPVRDDYRYDSAGNRDDAAAGGAPLGTHVYDPNNRLSSIRGRVHEFDPDGNLTLVSSGGAPVARLTFDSTNQLRRHESLPSGRAVRFSYDPFGRRIRKEVDGAVTWYAWDGDQVLAEYGASGARTVRYAYGTGFAPIEVAYGSSSTEVVQTVHTDHLDAPRLLTDASGRESWRASYAAFGAAQIDTDPDRNGVPAPRFDVRLPGQSEDGEAGLLYNRYRHYDAAAGRYVSADPVGQFGVFASNRVARVLPLSTDPFLDPMPDDFELAGTNLFAYAASSPVNAVDPLGLSVGCVRDCLEEVLGIESLVGAALVAAGQPVLPTRAKPRGAVKGTSPASRAASAVFGKMRFGSPKPTLVRNGLKLTIRRTASVARVVGRAVPVVGTALLVLDAIEFTVCLTKCESPCAE